MKKLLLLSLLFFPISVSAARYQVTQGDVLTIHRGMPQGDVTVRCLGKNWPVVREADGKVWAWIGVDLKTSAKTHPVVWRAGSWQERDELIVNKGEFRVSYINVEKKMAEFDKPTLARIRADQQLLKNSYVAKVEATPFIHLTRMPTEGIESTPFGAQRYVNGEPRSPHSGLDIAAPEGTPVITPLAGKVLVVSDMYLNGNTIAIGHGYGLVSVFSHLKTAAVKEGEWVEAGRQIGEVGKTGRATGPHLHWGIRFNQARINPHSILRINK